MTSKEVRAKYIEFFKSKGHVEIPSAKLVPENDPTTLFTGSGMQPMIPYLLGENHPLGTRIVDSQKSFRTGDIEEVGDNRHTTFFEMLGNWSLGDESVGGYSKREQISWLFEFYTDVVLLDPSRLYVTVFQGDEKNKLPKDIESPKIWKELFTAKGIAAKELELGSEENASKVGIADARIFYYDSAKNWWSRWGRPEKMPAGDPGGPDTEVFFRFDIVHDKKFGEHCHPNCDCGQFMEIGNSVFMEYLKTESGFVPLPRKNVDFGGGLERIAAASNGDPADVYKIDSLWPIIEELQKKSGKSYDDLNYQKSFRVIADHARAAIFLIRDGVEPSNTEQGYFVRRLIRRAVRHADKLGIPENALGFAAKVIFNIYHDAYPANLEEINHVEEVIKKEEQKFRDTLKNGLKIFEKIAALGRITGLEAFTLFTTYGFPIELTEEIALERELSLDKLGFENELKKHQELSRAGSEKKFKGGLADHSDKSIQYHTATHLLHKALRDVLGLHVFQKGSNITPERLRFDFSHPDKMTPEQIKQVEDIVNARIKEALPVSYEDLPIDEAEKRGAIGLFEEKYGDKVRVYKVGDYSMEFCGGPHVSNTNELKGTFKIKKEEAVAQGIRRIKAVLE